MYRLIFAVISSISIAPLSAIADEEISRSLFSQLKINIEKSCTNKDYLDCIETSDAICHKVSDSQLQKISQIIENQAQTVADGQINRLLAVIKTARSQILEENNIEIGKANACGKQFLIN